MKSQLRPASEWPTKVLDDFPLTRRYLIGVSGGRDSTALLRWLHHRGYNDLIVCHLDHQLRGRASAADARFVAGLARKYGLQFEHGAVNLQAVAAKRKMSIETAGRAVRYEFFARVARRRRCRTVFLAHHADDETETFLMNLFRGAGPRGLATMREVTVRRIDGVDLTIVRPLLAIWRQELDSYVRSHRLKFREDASNRDLLPLRNRIRHRIIPYLEKTVGRDIRQSIWRTAMITAEEENFFEELLPRELTQLAVAEMRAMPVAMQRRTLREWLRAHQVPDVSFALVERVRDLADMVTGAAKTNLPGNRHARRRAGKLFIE